MHCQFAIWLEGGLGTENRKGLWFPRLEGSWNRSFKTIGKRCIVRHYSSLGLQRSADGLQRPLLIPPAQKILLIINISSSGYTDTLQWRQCISFQLSSNEDILIPEAMLIRLQKDLSLLAIISKLCLKEKKLKEKVKRNLRMQIYLSTSLTL